MTAPTQGLYTLRCDSCDGVAYSSDAVPPADVRATLQAFADTQCPRGGTAGGCPYTAVALAESEERRGARLRQLIQAARDRLPRTRRLALPAIIANAAPLEIEITWSAPLPDAGYCVLARAVVPAALLGWIDVSPKPGTFTAAGCTILVQARRDVPAATAGLHIVAVP